MNKSFEKILDRLRNLAENYGRLQFGFNDSCEIQKYVGMEQAVDLAIEIVQEVAEEYNNGWIPCSERLPEADENVLTCSEYGFITVSSCNDSGEFSSYADEYCIKYPKPKVIAWQPLPEPYKPEGE